MRALDIAATAPITLAGQALAVVSIIAGAVVVIGIAAIIAAWAAPTSDNAVVKS